MRYTVVLLVAVLLASCSPQKRLARLVKNHPELMQSDTFLVIDTLTLPGSVRLDTFYLGTGAVDTFVSENDTVRVTIIRYKDRLITKTLVKPVKVPVVKKVVISPKLDVTPKPQKITWRWFLRQFGGIAGVLLMTCILIIFMAWRRRG